MKVYLKAGRGPAMCCLALGVIACLTLSALAGDSVVESARDIPLAYDVDVVVVGGSTRAVSAALAAKEAGASVFLLARRTYLGADMCATYRLWLELGQRPDTGLAEAIFREKRMATPLMVKSACDNALIEAGVDFLFGSYVTDVLRDSKGHLAGIVMANRSGRQAVRAKVIIDATEYATAARLAGAEFSQFQGGEQDFVRRVVGGVPAGEQTPETVVRDFVIQSDSRRGRRPSTNDVYQYTLSVSMRDSSWASYAKAEQEMRTKSWQRGQVDGAESVFHYPADRIKAVGEGGAGRGFEKLDLDALRPAGTDGLYVFGGCADVSKATAEKMLSPVTGMALGELVGKAAASDAAKRDVGAAKDLAVPGREGGRYAGDIGEMLNGLRSRPSLRKLANVRSPERAIPVIGKYDVVIVGGGTGGAPAGIAASRAGAKTLVVEYLDGLGGVATMGRITRYYHGNRVGFTPEIDAGVNSLGKTSIVERKMEWFRREILKAGGDIWFHTLACGSVMKGKRFVGVVVATPLGRGVVLANTVIDSTGNAVIPACAGVPCQEIGGDHISVQGTGLPTFAPGVGYLNGDWTFNDDSDVLDMWRIFVVGKHKAVKNERGREAPFDLGQLINTRARRRIIGDIVITPMDVINERTYPDVITVSKSNFDNHGFSSHDLFMIMPPRSRLCNLPYRALMPKGYDGLLATGLGISAHGDAMPVLRMQPDVQNHGYAAGYAAALAAMGNKTARTIDVKELQKHLVEKGIINEEMLSMSDSYPIGADEMLEAVSATATSNVGIAVILTDPGRAMPLLQEAWRKSDDDKAKLRYGHVLGILGDATGVESLVDALQEAEWDKGWNFRGMGQYGPTTSPVDNLVIALGRTRDKRALKPVLRMLGKLDEKSHFSHCRAVAMALERLGDRKAAKPLAKLLNREGMMGHAFTDIRDEIERTPGNFGDTSTRNTSLKELILARALYRCGDYKGLGERILREYAEDLRGHYATHAKAVLSESD